jgi:hypothetical protein
LAVSTRTKYHPGTSIVVKVRLDSEATFDFAVSVYDTSLGQSSNCNVALNTQTPQAQGLKQQQVLQPATQTQEEQEQHNSHNTAATAATAGRAAHAIAAAASSHSSHNSHNSRKCAVSSDIGLRAAVQSSLLGQVYKIILEPEMRLDRVFYDIIVASHVVSSARFCQLSPECF